MKDLISMGIDPASRTTGIAVVKNGKLVVTHVFDTHLKAGYTDNQLAEALDDLRLCVEDHRIAYNPEIVVTELVASTRNMDTVRLLAYFEGAAMSGSFVSEEGPIIHRERVTRARKQVLGKGSLNKEEAAALVRKRFQSPDLTLDETDACVLALYGQWMIS